MSTITTKKLVFQERRKGYAPAMQISMKCSVAVHCLIFIHEAKGVARVTSTLLVESTGYNPVVIPNILRALKTVSRITVHRDAGGVEFCADPSPRSPSTRSMPRWNRRTESPNSGFIPVRDAPARWHKTSGRCCRRHIIKSRGHHQDHYGKHHAAIHAGRLP